MRYDSAGPFATYTNSAAATCSISLTASARNIFINAVTVFSDLSNATVKIQASGTTLWQTVLGSACVGGHYPLLSIDAAEAQTLSANIDATANASIALCGKVRAL